MLDYDNCHWKKLNNDEISIIINNIPSIDEYNIIDYVFCMDSHITDENVKNNVLIVMFIKSRKTYNNFSTYQYTDSRKCGFMSDKYNGVGQILNKSITLNNYTKAVTKLIKHINQMKFILIINMDFIKDINFYIASIFMNL